MKNSQTNQGSFWKSDAALIMLALTWGTSHVIQKDILATHSPAFYTSARFGIAALCFGLLFAKHLWRSDRKEIVKGAWLGFFSFAGIAFYTSGLVFTQASKAGFITGLYLVFTPLLGYLLFRSRPTRDHLTGLVVAVGGFALLSYPQNGESVNWGDILILFAAVAWAAHIAATSAFASESDVRTLASAQVIVVAALSLSTYFILSWVAGSAADPQSLPALVAMEARSNPIELDLRRAGSLHGCCCHVHRGSGPDVGAEKSLFDARGDNLRARTGYRGRLRISVSERETGLAERRRRGVDHHRGDDFAAETGDQIDEERGHRIEE